jgi:hypothetical protein
MALQAKEGNSDATGRVPSEAGDEQASEPVKPMENLEQHLGEKLKADSDCGRENLDRRPSTANVAGDKEKEKEKKKSTVSLVKNRLRLGNEKRWRSCWESCVVT